MKRFLLLTLFCSISIVIGFELIRSLAWAGEIKIVIYLLFLSGIIYAYVRAVDRLGIIEDWVKG